MHPLAVVTLTVGPLQENTHLLGPEGPGEAMVVDPGDEADRILAAAQQRGWTLKFIVLTHGHADHVGAVPAIRRATSAPVAASPAEAPYFADRILSGALWLGYPFEPVAIDIPLREPEPWPALGRTWKILDTPGHTPGHICLYSEPDRLLVAGDVLFAGSVGRSDLPGGSWDALAHSLQSRIFTLPDDTRVLTGHGPDTTLGAERSGNVYVRQALSGGTDPALLLDNPFR